MESDALERVAELVRPSLTHCGVALERLHWAGGAGRGRGGVLRLVIDKDGGVTLDDCERVSSAVGAVLDAYDPIDAPYQLEVSSPGAERSVEGPGGWRDAVGRRVNVRFRSGDAETIVEGRLVGAAGDRIEVERREGRNRTRMTTVPMDSILAGRIVVDI